MKISVYSGNRYIFSENLTKVEQEKTTTSTVNNSTSGNTDSVNSDFETTFSNIKDMLQQKIDSSKTNFSTIGTTTFSTLETGYLPITSSDIHKTAAGYESIAPKELKSIFKEAAQTYGIDQKLLELIGYHESRFTADAVSRSGAVGIMQLMPDTARGLGVEDSYDPYQNIMGAAKLIARLANDYSDDLDLMLAGYSAGQGAVSRYNGVPPYEETTNYISWIRARYP